MFFVIIHDVIDKYYIFDSSVNRTILEKTGFSYCGEEGTY